MISSLNFTDNDTVFDVTEVTEKMDIVITIYDKENEMYGNFIRLKIDQLELLREWLNKQISWLEVIENNAGVEK